MNDVKLLPVPYWAHNYKHLRLQPLTIQQRAREYARACIEANRKTRWDGIGVGVDVTADGVQVAIRSGTTLIYNELHALPKARTDGGEAVARVELNGLSMSGLVWTEAGRKADLRDGTNLYTHPGPADVARLVESVSKALKERNGHGVTGSTFGAMWEALEPFTAAQQEVQP